jgi:hypothetical protein
MITLTHRNGRLWFVRLVGTGEALPIRYERRCWRSNTYRMALRHE